MISVSDTYKYYRYYFKNTPENADIIRQLDAMTGHARKELITNLLIQYFRPGSDVDMKAADIIADEAFENVLKRLDALERDVRKITTERSDVDGNKLWKKFHTEDISINELNE